MSDDGSLLRPEGQGRCCGSKATLRRGRVCAALDEAQRVPTPCQRRSAVDPLFLGTGVTRMDGSGRLSGGRREVAHLRSLSRVLLTLDEARQAGRAAYFLEYGEALLCAGGQIFEVSEVIRALQADRRPSPLPAAVSQRRRRHRVRLTSCGRLRLSHLCLAAWRSDAGATAGRRPARRLTQIGPPRGSGEARGGPGNNYPLSRSVKAIIRRAERPAASRSACRRRWPTRKVPAARTDHPARTGGSRCQPLCDAERPAAGEGPRGGPLEQTEGYRGCSATPTIRRA
jgi:hypothetical protein